MVFNRRPFRKINIPDIFSCAVVVAFFTPLPTYLFLFTYTPREPAKIPAEIRLNPIVLTPACCASWSEHAYADFSCASSTTNGAVVLLGSLPLPNPAYIKAGPSIHDVIKSINQHTVTEEEAHQNEMILNGNQSNY